MSDKHRLLRNALGRFATGVTVIACKTEDGEFCGMTANSFASVSLEPPLVLWCIRKRASVYSTFISAGSFAVSVLPADQHELSERFARRNPKDFSLLDVDVFQTGAPLLKDRIAGFDCLVRELYQGGDHTIVLGEVVAFDSLTGDPLVYFASDYHKVETLTTPHYIQYGS